MAWTQKQAVTTGSSSGTAPTTAYGSAVTANSLLVATISIVSDTETITSVTDSVNGGSWILADGGPSAGLGERPYIYYKYNTGAGTPTVTVNKSGSAICVFQLHEFAGGLFASDPLDKHDNAQGTASAPSKSLVGVAANALVIGMVVSNGDPTVGAAFTQGAENTSNWYENSEYLLDQGSAGNRTVDWSGSGTWTMACASFLLSAASGGTTKVVSESISVIDQIVRWFRRTRRSSDAINVTGSQVWVREWITGSDDAISVDDGSIKSFRLKRLVSEAVTVLDEMVKRLGSAVNVKVVSDTTTMSDAFVRAVSFSRMSGDQVVVSDGLYDWVRRLRGLIEIVSVVDDVVSFRLNKRAISEALDVPESVVGTYVPYITYLYNPRIFIGHDEVFTIGGYSA